MSEPKRLQLCPELIEHFGHVPTVTEIRQMFNRRKASPPLIPLGKPCHDCAVVDGFYKPVAEALRLLPSGEQEFHAERWFCHNKPDRSCAGVRETIANTLLELINEAPVMEQHDE